MPIFTSSTTTKLTNYGFSEQECFDFVLKITHFNYTIMNLNEYFLKYEGSKNSLFRDISKACGVSMMTAERWCRFYYKADEKYLEALSNLTGIEQNMLFSGF